MSDATPDEENGPPRATPETEAIAQGRTYIVVLETGALRVATKPIAANDAEHAAHIGLSQDPVLYGAVERSQTTDGATNLHIEVYALLEANGTEPAFEAHPYDIVEISDEP